jgi:hypothetical protein
MARYKRFCVCDVIFLSLPRWDSDQYCGDIIATLSALCPAIYIKFKKKSSSVICRISDLHVYLETNTNSSSFSASFVRGLPLGRLLYLKYISLHVAEIYNV